MCWKTRFRFLLEPSNLHRHTKKDLMVFRFVVLQMRMRDPLFWLQTVVCLKLPQGLYYMPENSKGLTRLRWCAGSLSLCWSPMSLLVWYNNDLLDMRLTRHQENWLYRGISVVKSHLNWLTHDLSRLFNPNKAGIPSVGFRQTVQIPIRRRKLRRLIRVFTVFLQDFQLQKEQKWKKIHKWQKDSPNE